MIVRTNLHAGEGELDLNQLMALGQQAAGQVDQQQALGMAQQALAQFDPNAVNALLQIAGGTTGPQQFLSMVGK